MLIRIFQVMSTLKTGETSNETCATCESAVKAFKVALRSFNKHDLVRWGKVGCKTIASELTAPEVCLGLLYSYIDVLSDHGALRNPLFPSQKFNDGANAVSVFHGTSRFKSEDFPQKGDDTSFAPR